RCESDADLWSAAPAGFRGSRRARRGRDMASRVRQWGGSAGHRERSARGWRGRDARQAVRRLARTRAVPQLPIGLRRRRIDNEARTLIVLRLVLGVVVRYDVGYERSDRLLRLRSVQRTAEASRLRERP